MRHIISFIVLTYIWIGYILNAILPFSYYDEIICVVFIFLLILKLNKEFLFFCGVFLFFLVYSLYFSVNPVVKAIFLDAVQQAKPFVFFYTAYSYGIDFLRREARWINYSILIGVILTLISFIFDNTFYTGLYTHPAQQGLCMFSFALLYVYINPKTRINLLICGIILIVGLLSLRSKYFGEFIASSLLLFFLKKKVVLNIKYIIYATCFVLTVLYVAWDKILINFYAGGDAENSARAVLYMYTPEVLRTYFPFGSGFASYATYYSGEYYSPLYRILKIDNVWGISPTMWNFIADTYFPSLSEFGILGIIFYLLFWRERLYNIYNTNNMWKYKIGMAVITFFMIESIASPAFVTAYGFLPLLVLGSICKTSYCIKWKK